MIDEHSDVVTVIKNITYSLFQLFDQNRLEKEKENEIKEIFASFNSRLDILFYLYLNWNVQGKTYLDDVVANCYNKENEVFYKINNRIFTIPELEPFSGTLVYNEKKENSGHTNPFIFVPRGLKKRSKSKKLERKELICQHIPYKECEKLTDAEIVETLNNFNFVNEFWSEVPLKQKFFYFKLIYSLRKNSE